MKETTYTEAVGRRKTSVARVRITPATKTSMVVNGKNLEDFFRIPAFSTTAISPLSGSEEDLGKFSISVKVLGGGISSQAGAIRHGLATALAKRTPEVRRGLKKQGFLKRDSRMKERRKFGLKKARKAAQWSKR